MNRPNTILTLVLACQLLLVVAVFWPDSNEGKDTAMHPLLDLQADSIDRIIIGDGTTSVMLARKGDGWRLPNYHGLPVDQKKLNRALMDLPALARGWPLTSSTTAANRFEVAEGNFQRQVEYFTEGESAGSLYLGTAPGFRKVHTRIAGDNAVYAVEFNTFDLPAQAAEWLDTSILQMTDVQVVQGLDYRIVKTNAGWRGKADNTPLQSEVDKLVNALTSLRVTAAVDLATATIFRNMDAPPTLSVESSQGSYALRLYEMEDAYYIQRDDIAVYFNLSAFDYDRLIEVTAVSLFPADQADLAE